MSTQLIDTTTDNVYMCMYQIGTLVFSYKDEKIVIDGTKVLAINKVDNYDYNLRSMLQLRLMIDIRQKIWILKNKANITCKFELDKFGMESTNLTEVSGQQIVWNEEFSIFLNDDDASIDTEGLELSLESTDGEFKSNNIEDVNFFTGQQLFDVYLYNTSLLEASKKPINKVYSSTTLRSAITHILGLSKHKKVLMSPFENSKAYSNLIIPNLPAYKAISYLDQYYGFYKRGALIYYDVDFLYILNTNGKATALQKKEWGETNIIVTPQIKSIPGNGMIKKEKQDKYYLNISEENVSPQRISDTKKLEFGDGIKIITTDDIKVSNTGNNSNQYQTYQRSDDNEYAASIIQARMDENDCILYIMGEGFDINAFVPNKSFHIIFEDATKQKRYGNFTYRIAYAQHHLTIQTQNYMKSSHLIALKKC